MATHSSILAWRIPGMGEPGGLSSMGSHRVGHDWSDLAAAAAARKAHLTSHLRMSGSRLVTTPLSQSLRLFLYSSPMYTCHLFLISSASVKSLPFLSFIMPIFAWNVPYISPIFLKKSLIFPILLFSSISLHCSLKKVFLSLLLFSGALNSVGYITPFLLCFSCLLFSQLFVRPPQTTISPFCISFSWGWSWSLPPV